MPNFFMQHNAEDFVTILQGYFNRPMSNTNKAFAMALLVLVILLILFMMVRTIMFIWKDDSKKKTLL